MIRILTTTLATIVFAVALIYLASMVAVRIALH